MPFEDTGLFPLNEKKEADVKLIKIRNMGSGVEKNSILLTRVSHMLNLAWMKSIADLNSLLFN